MLNNPLKYVDPSGNVVNIIGIGDVSNVNMGIMWWLMQMTEAARGEVLETLEAYDHLSNSYSGYTNYLETTDEVFDITTNDDVSEAELDRVNDGVTLLQIEAGTTTVRRYTPEGFWNFLTGGWVYEAKRPPIDWQKAGNDLGKALLGTVEIVTGTFMTMAGVVGAGVSILGGVPPEEAFQFYTFVGITLIVDGVKTASSGKHNLDTNWLPYPLW